MTKNKQLLPRRYFPNFGKLEFQVDIERLSQELTQLCNRNDTSWNDLTASGTFKHLCAQQPELHSKFKEGDDDFGYKQLSLTRFNNEKYGKNFDSSPQPVKLGKIEKYRFDNARGETSEEQYDPLKDERCYDLIRDELRTTCPYTISVLEKFKGHVTRVRYAKIAPGFSIAPHIDYNTTYSVRYHIPIITNEQAILGVRRNKTQEFECSHFPSDGNVYFMNTGYEHFAENQGPHDRIHLVIGVDGQQDIQHLVENKQVAEQ